MEGKISKANEKLKCKYCDKEISRSNMSKHLKNMHDIKKEPKAAKVACEICGKEYVESYMKKHFAKEHSNNETQPLMKEKITCEISDKHSNNKAKKSEPQINSQELQINSQESQSIIRTEIKNAMNDYYIDKIPLILKIAQQYLSKCKCKCYSTAVDLTELGDEIVNLLKNTSNTVELPPKPNLESEDINTESKSDCNAESKSDCNAENLDIEDINTEPKSDFTSVEGICPRCDRSDLVKADEGDLYCMYCSDYVIKKKS